MNKPLSLTEIVHADPELLHGEPVFKGTRVPVRALIDHLEAGDPLSVFLDSFPSVTEEQAVSFIELASQAALAELRAIAS